MTAADTQNSLLNSYEWDRNTGVLDDENNDIESPYDTLKFDCNYFSEDEFLKKFSKIDDLTLLSLNIQSLQAKFNELNSFIQILQANNSSPDIICLQEIWNISSNFNVAINGYHLPIINARTNSKGGGVCIYISSNLKYKSLKDLSPFLERIVESVFVEIDVSFNSPQKKIILGSIYRPPHHPTLSNSDQIDQFLEILSNFLQQFAFEKENLFIAGDVNLNLAKIHNNNYVNQYIDLLMSFGCVQVITKPTRVTMNSASIIDHIITNCNNVTHTTGILLSDLSDHFPIIYCIDLKKRPVKTKKLFVEIIAMKTLKNLKRPF